MLVEELRIDFRRIVYWTDSTTVLRWLRSPKVKFSAYVGARIGEICELSDPEQWHYVPTAVNPADDASRGISPRDLCASHRWFHGPEFLQRVPDEWPASPIDSVAVSAESDPEIRSSMDIFATTVALDRIASLIDSVSRIDRLYRIASYVLRWSKLNHLGCQIVKSR